MIQTTDFPSRITVELTNQCNIACTFCPRHLVEMNPGFMDESLYCKIIDEAAQHLPVCLAVFLRGESLLHSKIVSFIRYAKEKGLGPVQLATNGLLMDAQMADKLINSGLDFISFSLDTEDETLYNRCRKHGNFQKSRANILSFLNKCQQLKHACKKVPETQLSTITTPEYLPGKQAFIDFWKPHADTVRVYQQHSADGHLGSLTDTCHDQSRIPCNKLFTDMVIYWDGTVALCNHDWDTKSAIGNVLDYTISQLWNGERYQQIRRMHIENQIEDSLVCKNCDHWMMYADEKGFIGERHRRIESDR